MALLTQEKHLLPAEFQDVSDQQQQLSAKTPAGQLIRFSVATGGFLGIKVTFHLRQFSSGCLGWSCQPAGLVPASVSIATHLNN